MAKAFLRHCAAEAEGKIHEETDACATGDKLQSPTDRKYLYTPMLMHIEKISN